MMSVKYLESRIYRSIVRINKNVSKAAEYLIYRNQLHFYTPATNQKWNALKGDNTDSNIKKK